MLSNLSEKIIATLIYYDILDYPLTSFEIWKHLIRIQETEISDQEEIKIEDIIKELESDKILGHVEEFCGYYFLRGRQDIVRMRIERNKISESKFKIVKRVVFLLRFVPFVRMVALTGRMAMKNTDQKSDLDFLIVLEHGHIFTGRLLVTLVIHLLGKRRYGQKIADRICLNYYITNKSLEISLKDLFSASEYTFIVPVFGSEFFKKFQKENSWIRNYTPNYHAEEVQNLKIMADSGFSKKFRFVGEKIFQFRLIEKILKNWQAKRISSDPRTHKDKAIIIADDDQLVFLPEPQGPGILERFQKKLGLLTKS